MSELYDSKFYVDQVDRSISSAQVIVPIIHEMLRPRSVLDIGCGVGSWLKVWLHTGVRDIQGIDGDYVDRDMLLIPREHFASHDLSTPFDLGRKFDIVCCLEVAEHLPSASASVLVKSLVRHSDVVLFSAAIPGQTGTGHINERWQSYWADLFATEGYLPSDQIRDKVWQNEQVEWWYRQNTILYCSPTAVEKYGWVSTSTPLDIVHPDLYLARLPIALYSKVSHKFAMIRRSLRKSLRSR